MVGQRQHLPGTAGTVGHRPAPLLRAAGVQQAQRLTLCHQQPLSFAAGASQRFSHRWPRGIGCACRHCRLQNQGQRQNADPDQARRG
jgi:hypothetical protein